LHGDFRVIVVHLDGFDQLIDQHSPF